MTVIYKGAKWVKNTDLAFRQDDGLHLTYNYRGIPSSIIGLANAHKDQGFDTYVFHDGPYSELTATRTEAWQSAGYQYIALWSVTHEMVEKSLFTLPTTYNADGTVARLGAIAEASLFDADFGGNAGYKKEIEDAVADRSALDSGMFSGFETAFIIHEELMRGVQTYEHEYTVLTRTLNFDFQQPPSEKLKLLSNKYIISTSQLSNWYGLPADVKVQLPSDSATAGTQRQWGWRIRDQSAEITNATTGQHRMSWVYAEWSTFLYTDWTAQTTKPNA